MNNFKHNEYGAAQKKLIDTIRSNANDRQSASFVDMVGAYETDTRLCLTSVIFPPKSFAEKIVHAVIKPLRSIEPEHFYYSEENLHVTIKNVRVIADPPNFTPEDIEKADKLFSGIIPRHDAFSFSFGDLVPLPTSASCMGTSDPELGPLVQELDEGLKRIGLADDKSYFSNSIFLATMTVCRYAKQPSPVFLEKINELSPINLGQIPARNVCLMRCNAICSPRTRTIIGSYALHATNAL